MNVDRNPPAAALRDRQPHRSRVETEVLRIRALLQAGRFTEAHAGAAALLSAVPENRDVLYMLAVSLRYLRRVPEALATLRRMESAHPDYSRLFQERGHCHVAMREPVPAIDAYLRAVNLNPALPAAWQALRQLFHAAGRHDEEVMAAGHCATLARIPQPIVTARSLFADGELLEAEHRVRQFLLTHGDHVEGMRLLAQIGMKLDVLDDAELLLENVVRIAPEYHAARHDYVDVLVKRHRHAKALQHVRRLLRMEPAHRSYRTLHAAVLVGLGDHAGALAEFRELAAEAPQAADVQLSIAHSLKTLGHQQEAIEAYRRAVAIRPGYGEAYWSLANLKTYRFTDAEIADMQASESAPSVRTEDRYHLCFALGKAFEDRADYGDSFHYYERGNLLKQSETRFKVEPIERNTQLQKAVCTRAFFESRKGWGASDPSPIFIVGMPRAGSTLLEQILASHSMVEGTMELADLPRLVQSLQGRERTDAEPRYPRALDSLSAEDCRRFGEQYLAETAVYRTGRRFFIDKMPNNFRHLGLIHLLLPNAKIIDARREPMACCFGNYKQLFASGQEFSYSLENMARYYRTYVELMAHWDAVLPGRVLKVQYEEVVGNLEGNVRRLLDFCGLPFEPACLEFHRTARSVRTASSEQVRLPLFREGLDQWRNYEPWLAPLQEALMPMLDG